MSRRLFTVSIVSVFLMLAIFGVSVAQAGASWVSFPSNPVLSANLTGWDSGGVFGPRVYYDGSIYRMWYTGTARILWGYRIGYAISKDGVYWGRPIADPVLQPGPPGSWDQDFVSSPAIIYNGSAYLMWYVGGKRPSEYRYFTYSGSQGFGFATSTDGINWTKYNNGSAVMTPSTVDTSVMYDPWVLHVGNQFKMWYTCGSIESYLELCYASSPDGIHWTKNPTPIFKGTGSASDWDADDVFAPNVLYDGHTYGMWYSGNLYSSQTVAKTQIGYATSSDGITWTRAAGNPILGPSVLANWDSGDVDESGILQAVGSFRLYYSAIASAHTNGPYAIGFAYPPAGFVLPELPSPTIIATVTLMLSTILLLVRKRRRLPHD